MKVFCDFHHGALGRWMFYLWADRLRYSLSFPGVDMMYHPACVARPGDWLPVYPGSLVHNVGIEQAELDRADIHFAGPDELESTDWDIIVLTRRESEILLKQMGHPQKGVIYIAVSGNEGSYYEWKWIKNLIATDLMTFRHSPGEPVLHKIHTPQELGRGFYRGGFEPIKPENLRVVGSFMNNLSGFATEVEVRNYSKPVNIWNLWQETRDLQPDYTWKPYGHSNQSIGGLALTEPFLPDAYRGCAMTWHFKTYEGFGHSALQGIPLGRPVLVPEGFFDDRTAGKYLVEGHTAYHVPYDASISDHTIRMVTHDLDTANEAALRCYERAQKLFDFDGEEQRIREWLKAVRAY